MALPLVGQKNLGFRTFFGQWIAPGARVTFLGPAGVFEDTFTENNRVATLNAALARCRSGKGDVVIALPGYTESISSADFASSLVAGTKLVSAGRPGASSNPTLTWTATASTFLLDVADVELVGFNLNFAGIDAVVAPITISAAGCLLANNLITLAAGAAGATTPITVAAGANNCSIIDNKMLHTGTETEVNVISITGAVNNLEIAGNKISCLLTSATGGIIQIGEAATNLDIHDNLFYNSVEDGIAIRCRHLRRYGLDLQQLRQDHRRWRHCCQHAEDGLVRRYHRIAHRLLPELLDRRGHGFRGYLAGWRYLVIRSAVPPQHLTPGGMTPAARGFLL